MAYEQKNNSGSVFKNQKKQNDKHPDFTGQALIDGKAYWVSAWGKTDKNDNAWFSFSFQDKEDKSKPVADKSRNLNDQFEDSIPF